MKIKITHVEGSRKGSVESFDAPMVTVGRDPANVLAFDPVKDDRVSTKHAALSEQGGNLIVTDLGSRNGTFVNGQKISGPTPVPSGALIQFGDSGPMVSVTFDAAPAVAAAPAPAAPPPKKSGGGKGCLAVLAVLALLVVGGAVGAYTLYKKFKPMADKAEAELEKDTGKPTESGKPADGEKPAETAKPAETKAQNPWLKCGVGSSFVQTSEMHMEKPAVMNMTTEMRYTVVSKTDDAAHIKMETTTSGTTSASEFDAKTTPADATQANKPVEQKDESVTVPAGTFSCHYTKTKTDQATIETWMCDDFPVAVKSVSTTDTTKTTMTLTKVDKK
jgi:pSer/pThr/pTyr-binding forkhead associated (FHA) protein